MRTFNLRILCDLGFELWQDIPGYEGLYQASTYGRIKSTKRVYIGRGGGKHIVQSHILSQELTRKGYSRVYLSVNNKGFHKLTHCLVASTFCPKYNADFNQVNHKNENKSSNECWNLEYCNQSYNITYGTRDKTVLQYDFENKLISEYKTALIAEKETGVCRSNISMCCTGKYKQAGGYIWKFKS